MRRANVGHNGKTKYILKAKLKGSARQCYMYRMQLGFVDDVAVGVLVLRLTSVHRGVAASV